MVAITVILAAVIGTFVLGLGDSVESTPQASFNFDQAAGSNNVTVKHRGGDSIDPSNLEIRGGGTVKYDDGTSLGSEFAARDSEKVTGVSDGDQIDVVYISSSGDSILASYTVQ